MDYLHTLELLDLDELELLYRVAKNKQVELRQLGYSRNDPSIKKLIRLGLLVVDAISSTYTFVSTPIAEYYIKEILDKKRRDFTIEEVKALLNDHVIGLYDLKRLIVKAIEQKEWILLYGEPGSGKSHILYVLSKLPKTKYFRGISVKKEEILNIIKKSQYVKLLLVDEIDKVHRSVIDAFITLYDMADHGDIDLVTIATANILKIPEWIKDRFYVVKMPKFTEDEIVEIVRRKIPDADPEVIKKIYRETGNLRETIRRIKLEIY